MKLFLSVIIWLVKLYYYDAVKFVERRTKVKNMSQAIHLNKHFDDKHAQNSDISVGEKITKPILFQNNGCFQLFSISNKQYLFFKN